MKVVIDIPSKTWALVREGHIPVRAYECIVNGTPLPKGHGRLIEAEMEAEQEPCEDAISRQAVLSKIKEVCFSEEWIQFRVDKGSNGQRDFLINYIKQLPPVTPKKKTGRWMSSTIQGEIDGQIVKAFICSECGAISVFRMSDGIINGDLCPNCGAKMAESEKTE